ncbi:MAG TPA: hypothetical protein VHL11_04720, partial [Phototrophicaceae bacterium]|nr:hypothetical protein [Phototrophicaceae bacterium]
MQPPVQPSQPFIPSPNQPTQGYTSQQSSQQPQPQSTQYGPAQPGQPGRRPPSKKANDKRLYWIAGGIAASGVLACVGMVGLLLLIFILQPRIPAGVRVAGLVVGGETLQSAESMLEKGYASQTLRLVDAERNWDVSLKDLGISVNVDETLKAAQKAAPNTALQPVYQIDFPQTQAKLINLSSEINVAPVNGNPPKDGKSLDIPFLLDRLRIDLNGEIGDGVVDLNMIEVAGVADPNADYAGVPIQHTVAAGEELGLISKKYNVDINDIVT